MLRRLLVPAVAALALVVCPTALAAPPGGFTAPQTLGANLQVAGGVAAADAAGGPYGAIAFADRMGGLWAARVRPAGGFGSPLPVAAGQRDVRDVQVTVTERGELVVVWSALVDRSGRAAVRYAAARPGQGFSGARTLAAIGSNTGATPRIAALRGGTVAVILRDVRPGRAAVLRYARRAPYHPFGPARSLGHDGVSPQIAAAPGGGALLAWARGPLTRRALEIASARRGAALPRPASAVAGRVRAITLAASDDGTAWVAWTRRNDTGAIGFARRIRAANVGAVGPGRWLGTVAYGAPHIALGPSASVLVAWNAHGPGTTPNVGLAAAQGSRTALGAPLEFDAGGFSQTSPIPARLRAAPLVLFTRQVSGPGGLRSEVAAADATTGDATVLGAAAAIGTPAAARVGDGLFVAWAADGGGVAVSVAP